MIELTKISADRAHKLFKLLIKLELFNLSPHYNDADEIYDAWRFAERNEVHATKQNKKW